MSAESDAVQAQISQFWNLVAPDYEDRPGNVVPVGSDDYSRWVELLGGVLPRPPADLLDIGTGTGFVALIATALGHRVTGIDLAADMLTAAQRIASSRGLAAEFVTGDAVAPPFPDASFDVVISRHMLWTLREPGRALQNWRRLLRPGGRAVVIDGFWFAGESDEHAEAGEGDDLFSRYYTRETQGALPGMRQDDRLSVVEAFTVAGFNHVTIEDLPAELVVDIDARPYVLMARR
jgi:ubiquinone/menaquinone biosynthesis C-methylase UbiE